MTEQDKDELLYFLRLAIECSSDSLKALSGSLGLLVDIDSLYFRLIRESTPHIPPASSLLLVNSHASYRAAIRLALSGEIMPVFMTLRGSIESVLYANAMVQDSGLCDVWLLRGKNRKARKECRKQFSISRMFEALAAAHSQDFADSVRLLYDTTIDFGGHPNYKTILESVRINDASSDEAKLQFTYIHNMDSFVSKQSLIACADTGVRILFIAIACNPEHPDLETLAARGNELNDQIENFVEQLGLKQGKAITER